MKRSKYPFKADEKISHKGMRVYKKDSRKKEKKKKKKERGNVLVESNDLCREKVKSSQ